MSCAEVEDSNLNEYMGVGSNGDRHGNSHGYRDSYGNCNGHAREVPVVLPAAALRLHLPR